MAQIEGWTFDELMNFEDSNTISLGRDPDRWRSAAVTPSVSKSQKGKTGTVKNAGKLKPGKSSPVDKVLSHKAGI